MSNKIPYIVKNIGTLLVIVLCIKIAGYFCIVEDRTINQIFKIIARVGMTGLVIILQFRLIRLGCQPLFKYENVLAPFFYLIYLFIAIASFSWSTDPAYSILQWLMTFESLVFVFIFMRVISIINAYFPDQTVDLIKTFTFAVFPIMLIFIVGSFIEPDLFYRGMRGGEEQRLGGYYMNPNELGMLSSIGAAMAYLYLQKVKKKLFPIVMLLAAIVVLALTASRSSAIGFVLIMGILILQSNNKKLKLAMFVGVALAVPAILKFVIFKDGGGVDEVLSMTGRIPFWKALLNEGIVKEPFFGYGFMRINYTDYFESLNTYAAKMTHNTFMQVLMNVGFIGFFVVFWQLVLTIRNFIKERKKSLYGNFFIALFIPAFINSLTEFGIFGETNYGILFYQFLILLFVIEINESRSKKETLLFNLFLKRWKIDPKLS
jgi:exopolysaccharide production protein ExoQ